MEAAALRNSAPPERVVPFFAYVTAVVTAAVAVFVVRAFRLPEAAGQISIAYGLIAALAVFSDARPFSAPGNRYASAVYPSICFTFALFLSLGLDAAVLVQLVAVLFTSILQRHVFWRVAFNIGQYTLAFGAAWLVRQAFDLPHLVPGVTLHANEVAVIILAAAAWFVTNDALVSTAIWLRFGGSWWTAASRSFSYEALSTSSLLLLSPVLVTAANTSAAMVPLIFVPLYAVSRMAHLSQVQEQRSLTDQLTGLPNRKALYREVRAQAAAHAERPVDRDGGARMALLLLDIDRFKQVNDALGHAIGDRLLTEVATRLRGCVPSTEMVARLGGDEYAVLTLGLPDVAAAQVRAEQIAEALAKPVPLDGLPLDVTAAIGVAIYPDHGIDPATLLQRAEVAMYDAKNRGATIAIYSPESDHNTPERLELLADLRRALEATHDEEISMYYQPQVEISTGEVVGVETLMRWQHPVRGPVDPEEAIRVAEHTAVMRLLTHRVVTDVMGQLAKWRTHGLTPRVAINVSARDLHSGELVDLLTNLMAEHAIPPEQVQLEITEGALMADPRRALVTLHRLDRLGVALSLDDFGTGYSSLQHLRRLPVAEVKIDRSFVLNMADDPDDAAVVRSIIDLAGTLGLRVVAEGVEDDRIRRLLAGLGCHVAQGWFYARPMPPEEFVEWLARYRPLPATPTVSPIGPVPGAGRTGRHRAKPAPYEQAPRGDWEPL